jgi:DNA replication protein DnaC
MSPTDDLVPLLKKLRLSGILLSLYLRTQQAVEDNLSHAEFLLRLLTDEVERRDAKQLDQRVRRANFEHKKTIEDFDFHFNPSVPRAKVLDLATCSFVERHDNVLVVGPTGVGKSHLAQALGHRACRAGHTVHYVAASDLFKQLRAARADSSYDRKLLRFTGPDLLIIDDLGLRELGPEEAQDLYEVVRHRYERGSLLVTSNRALEEWPALFGNPLLSSAAMDRLLHHAHVLVLTGDSYRNPPPQKARRPSSKAAAAEVNP